MKLRLTTLLLLISVLSFAQFTGNGYYRVHNKATSRYIYVLDNTGSINISTASADMGAIELYKDTARMHHDPATVIYARQVAAGKYDLEAQGTGVHQIIGYYVDVYQKSDGSYQVYAEGKYLDDNETSGRDLGFLGTERTGEYRLWYINAIDQTANYFGILPTIQLGTKYYKPFYAAFPFSFIGTGMKAYYIKNTYTNAAILEEVNGIVPAATPVFIECESSQQWHNKLQIAPAGTPATLPNNLLCGVYFNNPNRRRSHDARTAYNPVSMRTLAVSPDGRLCFVKNTAITYLPANEAYLTVPASAADTLFVMTEAEYRTYSIASSISLSSSSLSLHPAETATLSATILPRTVAVSTPAWASSDSSVVRISVDAQGVCTCTAVGVGTTQVTASTTDGSSLQAQCEVTVLPILATGISLSSSMLSGVEGDVFSLTATVAPSNATDPSVSWISSNTDVATVAEGIVSIVGVGSAIITASTMDGSQLSAACSVVGNPIRVTSVSLSSRLSERDSLSVGDTLTLVPTVLPSNATNPSLRWSSSNSSRVSVDSLGVCCALSAGSAIITATSTDGTRISAQYQVNVRPVLATSLTISQDTVRLSVGDNVQFTCQLQPANVSDKSVLWSVTDPEIASVSAMGYVTTLSPGQTTVTVSTLDGSKLTASCVLMVADTIVPPTIASSIQLFSSTGLPVDNQNIQLLLEDTLGLSALVLPFETSDKSVVWTSSDTSVVRISVDSTDVCYCYAFALGSALVSATTLDGSALSASCTVTVNPILSKHILLSQQQASLLLGDTLSLSAMVLPLNATDKSVCWATSDSSVVRIDFSGDSCVCYTVGVGAASVSVMTQDGSALREECAIVVAPRLVQTVNIYMEDGTTISEMGLILSLNDSVQFSAVVLPENATNKSVLWESSEPVVLSVDAQGRCAAMGIGTSVVRATAADGSGVFAEVLVQVDPIWVTSILLSADSLSMYENESKRLIATVLPANATFQYVDFVSSDETIFVVSQDGTVTGLREGDAYVEAIAQDGSGVSAMCNIRVMLFTNLIELLHENPDALAIYDLLGHRLTAIPCSGFYVVNGRVIYVIR